MIVNKINFNVGSYVIIKPNGGAVVRAEELFPHSLYNEITL